MSIDELLNDSTFTQLFAKTDEIEREKEKIRLTQLAKNIGHEKDFKAMLKIWEKKVKTNKTFFDNSVDLPESNYKISNYNMGSYQCSPSGIVDHTNYKFSYIPILPVERFINEDTGKEKVKIIYYKEKKWHELIVDRSQLAVGTKLLQLSDFGLDITSENVKYYVNYFNEIINLNNIKKLDSVSHIGWKGDSFIPFNKEAIFDGEDDFKHIFKAITKKGDYEAWKQTVGELRTNKSIRMLMATTLASPLLEKLNLQPFIVNAWSSLSGNGKTLSCMVAMSVWGNPDTGSLRFSSNNTINYYITVASFMRNITCYFDELQIIKNNRYFDTESLVMDLCNQTEKGRLNKNSQAKEVKTWYNNFLFTSNDKLVKDNAGEQVYNRVIDLEIREKIYDDGVKIANIIKSNYGFAGDEYIKHLQKIGFDKVREYFNDFFNKIIKETKATDKQASSLATLMLADKLIGECIFDTELDLEIADIIEYVNDKDEILTCMRAKEYIISHLNANSKRFDDNGYGEIWGMKDQYYYKINAEILMREMKKGGYHFDTVKKEWAEMDFLELNSQGRYYHNTKIRQEKGNYIYLKIDQN